MERRRIEARWREATGTGLEQLALTIGAEGIAAEGLVLGPAGGAGSPLGVEGRALRYALVCDPGWTLRRATIARLGGETLTLLRGDDGSWHDGEGRRLRGLDGAIDLDLFATPFTNTLPIRRLGLEIGESRDLVMAFVDLDAHGLTVAPAPQRYTRLAPRLWRFESLDADFTRDLLVDGEGLVVDYPGLFMRVG